MLKTKLNKPNPTAKLIFRKELIDLIETGQQKKLTLVSAPAGYGKSTLISQWIDHCLCAYSWYSLDESDNDINNFLQYTIAGIQSVYSNIGVDAEKLLKSGSNPSFKTIATILINDLVEVKAHFYIIFDDYHVIENKEINDFLAFLLDNLPASIHLVLITRSDPSIHLARLRSQQLVTDIRLADLCFNANNIYDFFKRCLNINLSIEDAQSLESKTEGWVAGLQLTGISLQGRDDYGEFIESLEGDNRYIMDYLIEEVLQQHSQEIREFLLCTSILNQFNASLCNHILNIQNGQEIIEQLERKNMFIVPLDNERNWFRYHHLFASLLNHRLGVRFKDRIPELHTHAGQWFENNDQLVFALKHSLAAGNKHKALNHFADVIDHLWRTSQYQTILQFGSRFTHKELIENVDLCFNYFWILFQSGYVDQAESLIYRLQNHTTNKAELAMVRVCINNLKVSVGDIGSVYKYSELAIQHINKDVDYWTILAFLSLGEVHLLKFELQKSLQAYDQAAARASKPQFIYFEMINRTRSSFVLWMLGDYSGSYKTAKDLLDEFNAAKADNSAGADFLSSIVSCIVGNILININQIEEGLEKSIRGYDLSKQTTNALLIASCTYLLAEAYYLAGEYNKAITLIEELDTIPYKQSTKFLGIPSDSLKCKLYLLSNKQDKLKTLFKKGTKTNKIVAFETIVHHIDSARHLIAQEKIIEANDLLQKIEEELKPEMAFGLLTEVKLLQARAHFLKQEQEKAIESLTAAIRQTQDFGLIRTYIVEGEEIEILLKELKRIKNHTTNKQFDSIDIEYINKIVGVFNKENRLPKIIPDEALSSRELDTLKLIAEDMSNQDIADQLYVSINTVKTHVRNILLKLEAKNRREAVMKAKEKGLLHL